MRSSETRTVHRETQPPPADVIRQQPEIATYATYGEAQAAVDALSDQRFPVERLTIVARGLRVVEYITGRRGYKEAMLSGMATGGLLGAAIGFFFGLFDWIEPITSSVVLALNGLIFGAVAGLVVGAVSQWTSAGRRDFSSRERVEADRYAVLCEPAHAAQAARLLKLEGQGPSRRGASPQG